MLPHTQSRLQAAEAAGGDKAAKERQGALRAPDARDGGTFGPAAARAAESLPQIWDSLEQPSLCFRNDGRDAAPDDANKMVAEFPAA